MYPRIHQEGSAYYITTNIQKGIKVFTRPSFIIPIFDSLNFYRFQHRCQLIGYVVMPDHLHLLIHPVGKLSTSSDFMRDFKRFTSGRISRQAELEGNTKWTASFQESGRNSKRAEMQVWQESFWVMMIYSDKFLRQKLNYIHMNPVRAGMVSDPADYPYSSYRNYELDDNTLIEVDRGWTSV